MDAEMKARELLAAEYPGEQCAFMRTLICTPLIEQRGVVETKIALRAVQRGIEYGRALEQPVQESRAITALKVTLFGIECWLPSGIAKAVQAACEQPASAAEDAARYRWLVENVRWQPPMPDKFGCFPSGVYLVGSMVSAVYGNLKDQCDRAIDAAIAAAPKESPGAGTGVGS